MDVEEHLPSVVLGCISITTAFLYFDAASWRDRLENVLFNQVVDPTDKLNLLYGHTVNVSWFVFLLILVEIGIDVLFEPMVQFILHVSDHYFTSVALVEVLEEVDDVTFTQDLAKDFVKDLEEAGVRDLAFMEHIVVLEERAYVVRHSAVLNLSTNLVDDLVRPIKVALGSHKSLVCLTCLFLKDTDVSVRNCLDKGSG